MDANLIKTYKISKIDKNNMDECISNIVGFHIKNTQNENSKINIEYSYMKYDEELKINNNSEMLLFSLILFFDNSLPMIFTNLNDESYKFKEIDNVSYSIIIPKENTYIIYDSLKYFGFLNIDKNKNNYVNCVNVNVYINELCGSIINHDDKFSIIDDTLTIVEHNKSVANTEMNEKILYNTNVNDTNDFINEVLNNTYEPGTIHYLKIHLNNDYDYDYLLCKYGKIVNDIIDIQKNDVIDVGNRFFNYKIIQNILSKDVCYWIINESEKINKWKKCEILEFEYEIDSEFISHVNNFIVYSLHFWLPHFKSVYDIPKNMKINIQSIFISKTENTKVLKKCEFDMKKYIVCVVQLNDICDFQGGEFSSDATNFIKLNQGDMLVRNNLTSYNKIDEGVNYSLVFLLELNLE